jgi:hypothetical protein
VPPPPPHLSFWLLYGTGVTAHNGQGEAQAIGLELIDTI